MDNDSLFFRTLCEYQQQYKDSLATGLDFRNVCQQVSGINFTDFFNQWYFGEGYPIFDLSWWQEADTVFLLSNQQTSTTVTTLFKMPLEYKLSWAGNDTIVRFYNQTNDTLFKYIINEEISQVEIDPKNWILISLYDTTNVSLVSNDALIDQQAVFILNDGSLVGLDGYSKPFFTEPLSNGLYIQVQHRNHLAILSADQTPSNKSIYSINFSENELTVSGGDNAYNQIEPGVWAMVSGDANSNGEVDLLDKSEKWATEVGRRGYNPADLNLNAQLENTDKDEYWLPNLGKSSTAYQSEKKDQ